MNRAIRAVRVRAGVVLLAAAGIVVVTACSRNANQENFIGKACQAASECPAPLLCVQSACWEPCNANGTCPTATQTCVLGACVPGGSAGGKDGGGSGSSNITGGAGGVGGTQPDGIVVRSNLTSDGPSNNSFAVDDAYVYYFQTTQGPLGSTTALMAAKLGSSDPEITVYSGAQVAGPSSGIVATNGYLYYMLTTGSPETTTLRRTAAGSTDASGQSITTVGSGGPGGQGSMLLSGKYLVFTDSSEGLRLYDTAAGTLDPTTYGTVTGSGAGGLLAAATDTELYWMESSGSTYDVVKATIPAGTKQATGDSFPSTAGANLQAMGVFGTRVVIFADSGNSAAILDASTQQNLVQWSGSGGAGNSSVTAFSGQYAFYSGAVTGSAEPLTRVSLVDGSSTPVATMVFQGFAHAIVVTSKYAYWIESDQGPVDAGVSNPVTNLRQKALP